MVAKNLPKAAPITRDGVKAPPEIPAPYVQHVIKKCMRKKIHSVGSEKAPEKEMMAMRLVQNKWSETTTASDH